MLRIQQGSILEVQAEAIVNAANSLGIMGGGVAGVIRKAAGPDPEREARQRAPIAIGEAILTSAGELPFKGIIHAPTMERPAMATTAEKVKQATRAALKTADAEGLASIAIPGMGTGVGRVPHAEAGRAMLEAVQEFDPEHLTRVIFVDIDERMVKAWQEALLTLGAQAEREGKD